MEFEMIQRQGLVVWLYTTKHARDLRKYGYVYYVSQKMRYAIMYIDQAVVETVVAQLERLNYVKKVELSHRDQIDMTFSQSIPDRIDKDAQLEADEDLQEPDFFQQIARQLQEESHQKDKPK